MGIPELGQPPLDPHRLKIDYFRMWQPEDHYSNMEPVYQ